MAINPNRDHARINQYVDKTFEGKVSFFPRFFDKIRFEHFRHIDDAELVFKNPVTVISGTNRSGKTSFLMAIACSHYHFMRRKVENGNVVRARWSDVMRFTSKDLQTHDWTYYVSYREGSNVVVDKRGQRKLNTKKWNGVAKKEGQIGRPSHEGDETGRYVCFIDMNRINPGRHLSNSNFQKARFLVSRHLTKGAEIEEYLSYVFEKDISVKLICKAEDGFVYELIAGGNYSSFNTASGEDAVLNMLVDILAMPNESLVLIDEIEIGLHPKLQRRLMDVIFRIARKNKIQFIVTTHSYAIMDSVEPSSRIFLDIHNGDVEVKQDITTEEALTRIDSERFPRASVYVEDEISEAIVRRAVSMLNVEYPGFARLVCVVPVGSANMTYDYFKNRQRLSDKDRFHRISLCVLDGDKRNETNRDGSLQFPAEADLTFIHSDMAPEEMLLNIYLDSHPNADLEHYRHGENPHVLAKKMVEFDVSATESEAIESWLTTFEASPDGVVYYEGLKSFLRRII